MERIWLKSYPDGIPADIIDEASAYASLSAMMLQSCQQYKDRIAYDSMGSTLSYAELIKQSEFLRPGCSLWVYKKAIAWH